MIICMLCRIVCLSGWCVSVRRVLWLVESISRVIVSIIRNLISVLFSLSSDLVENICFSFDSGLSWLNLGCSVFIENS